MDIRVHLLVLACMLVPISTLIPTTQAASIGVQAILLPSCQAGTSSSGSTSFDTLNFGNYASLNSLINATSTQLAGSIRVRCVSGVSYKILMDGGNSGNVTSRRMQNTLNSGLVILYNLYTDKPGGIIWNNTTGVSNTGNGNDQWHNVYGQVPSQTTPAAGIYRDTINVTVSW